MIATAAPRFACPDWCQLTRAEHLAQVIADDDGGVMHERAVGMVRIVHSTRRDGSVYDVEPSPSIVVMADGYLDLESAEQLLGELLAAIRILRT